MKLAFREYLAESKLIESFDISNNYKELSKSNAIKYWLKITNIKPENSNLIDGIYNTYHKLKCYYTKNEGREYFIFSYVENNIFEIHFIDLDEIDEETSNDNKGFTKTSQHVFSVVMSIVLKEIEERPNIKIKIAAPNGRETLYKKIIDKTLKKYNVEKHMSVVLSKNDFDKVIHNFLLEKYQGKIRIGIE